MAELTSAHFPEVPPAGWSRVPIGAAIEEISRPIRMRDDEEYRLVSVRRRYGGMFDRDRLPGRKILTKNLERVEPGAFILARMQVIHGASCIVPSEMEGAAVSKSYVQFLPRRNTDMRFFGWLSQAPEMKTLFMDASQGVVIEKMTFDLKRWLGFEVNLPPLPEQRRIAEILDTLDDLILKTEQLVAKLKQVKQGLLHDLLTRGIDENGELRDPERHPEQFKDSPLGRIPKAWEVELLAEVADVRSGLAKNEGRAVRDPIDVHYLRVANVQDGFLDLDDMATLRVGRAELDRYRVRPGDVLMNEGGDLDKLGRGAMWAGQFEPCIHQNHVFVVRCGPSIMPRFLDAWTGSPVSRRYFMVAGKQTTNLASINKTALGRLPVVLPPLAEQQRLVDVLLAQTALEDQHSDELEKLTLLKSGLMEDLLTGRIRVTDLEDAA